MVYCEFNNSNGKIQMGQGFDWRIIEFDGLGLIQKDRNVTSYADQIGQELLSETVGARVITISGDIKNSNDTAKEKSKIIRIINQEGYLSLTINNKQRKIKCICTTADFPKRNGAYQPFVLQFTADYPYFGDLKNTTINIFSRTALLVSPFIFPTDDSGLMFSSRVNKVNVLNRGDVVTEPIIYISSTSASTLTGGITVKNNTTGQQITLLYQNTTNELITVDVENRTITSSINGSIINYISDDTFLNDFWLQLGTNEIEIINNNGNEVTAVCEFSNKYIEGDY